MLAGCRTSRRSAMPDTVLERLGQGPGAFSRGARGACPSQERAFSRGARGARPSQERAFSRGARGARPSQERAFSRGARGARPSQAKSLQPGSARGLPLARESLQPGSARGLPLARESLQPGSARDLRSRWSLRFAKTPARGSARAPPRRGSPLARKPSARQGDGFGGANRFTAHTRRTGLRNARGGRSSAPSPSRCGGAFRGSPRVSAA